ncbi:butyrophilin subfamily 1 member A1-like [Clarias gariepinus]
MFLCVTFLILYSFLESQSESLKVVGPEAPLVAVAGDDLLLPCFIKPNNSAVDMRVEWFKLDAVNSLVHLYENHEDRNEKQAQSYKGRTSLFKEELQRGDASLKLSALQVTDEGEYKCFIEDKSGFDDTTVQIIVEVKGSHPVIMMESYDNSGGINLVCESRGWNPSPDVQWLDREGAPLTAEETQIHRETEGFSVKRRITVYDYSDSNRFYCRFQQTHHMIEAEVIINGKVFDAWKWIVVISFSACLFTVGWIVTAVIFRKKVLQRRMMEHELAEMKTFEDPQRKRVEDELARKKQYSVDVTLDPDTAHPNLKVSEDGKQVTCGNTPQDLPDKPQRFDYGPFVLTKQSFSSRRFYYEVQVSGKTEWTLGVVRESINRKETITLNPQNGVWTIELRNENEYWANADSDVLLTLMDKVEKVGVFVDYMKGQVSFYDVKARSHIFSFTAQSFNEKLYPLFSPREEDNNLAPLIITAGNE